MADIKVSGQVQPGEFQFVIYPTEYIEAGVDAVTSESIVDPYALGLIEVTCKDDGKIIIHGHPYVGGLYDTILAEVLGRNVYGRILDEARSSLKNYAQAGRTAGKIDLSIRELRHILRALRLMEPVS